MMQSAKPLSAVANRRRSVNRRGADTPAAIMRWPARVSVDDVTDRHALCYGKITHPISDVLGGGPNGDDVSDWPIQSIDSPFGLTAETYRNLDKGCLSVGKRRMEARSSGSHVHARRTGLSTRLETKQRPRGSRRRIDGVSRGRGADVGIPDGIERRVLVRVFH